MSRNCTAWSKSHATFNGDLKTSGSAAKRAGRLKDYTRDRTVPEGSSDGGRTIVTELGRSSQVAAVMMENGPM